MIENLKKILEVDKSKNENEALQMLYSDLYDILSKSNIDECENYLKEFLEMDFSALLKTGFVRITKPHKDKLKNREKLIESLKVSLSKVCSEEEAASVLFHVA